MIGRSRIRTSFSGKSAPRIPSAGDRRLVLRERRLFATFSPSVFQSRNRRMPRARKIRLKSDPLRSRACEIVVVVSTSGGETNFIVASFDCCICPQQQQFSKNRTDRGVSTRGQATPQARKGGVETIWRKPDMCTKGLIFNTFPMSIYSTSGLAPTTQDRF